MKYIKYFDTHDEYEDYIATNEILPNVSYCDNNYEVHYNPIETNIIATFSGPGNKVIINSNKLSLCSKIEIDGTPLQNVVNTYTFTDGEHTVRYTLIDPTIIGESLFFGCEFTSVKIPDNVITISNSSFGNTQNLTNIEFGRGITNIGTSVFALNSVLTELTIKALTPPTLGISALEPTLETIYVPSESVNAYKIASGWSDYANIIQAI